MLIIAYDDEKTWFRYHPLLGSLLQQLLASTVEASRVHEIQKRASRWFADNGLFEDAVRYASNAGDLVFAIALVGRIRHSCLASDEWSLLERLLNLFGREVVENNLPLKLLECWLDLNHRYKLDALYEHLGRAAKVHRMMWWQPQIWSCAVFARLRSKI